MPYQIIRNDIVTMSVDAIVNPTDAVFSGSGGVDARVHFAAGPQMRTACDQLPVLDMGQVAVTEGFQLPCRYVIHTFGPIWLGGGHREKELLSACYRNALHAARKLNCKTVATPLISSGTFGYPKDKVLRVALEAITDFLMQFDMTVYLLVYDRQSYEISKRLQADIDSYIDANYIARQELVFDPYVIRELDGMKVAFVGVTTPKTLTSSTPRYFQDENGEFVYGFFQDETGEGVYNAVQSAVDDARAEGADYVVVLGHMGNEEECHPWTYSDVISNVSGIDVFLDGHSHDTDQVVMKDKDGKEVIRAACGTKLACIGWCRIDTEGKITTGLYTWNNNESAPALLGIANKTSAFVDKATSALEKKLTEVVANSQVLRPRPTWAICAPTPTAASPAPTSPLSTAAASA